MRHRRLLLIALSAALLVRPTVGHAQHVVATGGDSIVLSAGSEAGVRTGMTGKICTPETVNGHIITNCSARFVVTSVSSDKAIAHISKGEVTSASGALVNFDEKLSRPREKPKSEKRESKPAKQTPPPVKRDQPTLFLQEADRAFHEGDYRGALERYENFLHSYPDHEQSDFAAERALQCRTKLGLAAPPPIVAPPAVTAPETAAVPPAAAAPAASVPPAILPPAAPVEVPAAVRQADELAARAERLFQEGQLSESRAQALQALRSDSTSSRARTTLRAVQLKSVQSRFNTPTDVAVNDAGCYVADSGNNTIRLVRPSASTTVAGAAGQYGSAGGSSALARFNEPNGVGLAADGTLYVSDRYNAIIRKIAPDGVVTTVAGRSGLTGSADGAAASARFNGPRRIAVAQDGTIYVADTGNHSVRKILSTGIVETVAASSPSDRMDPIGLAIDGEGNILIADAWSHVIRKIDGAGRLSVAAGLSGVSGSVDGPVGSARFNAPEGIAVDAGGALYVADTGNHTIRKIMNGVVSTVAGRAGLADAVDGSGPAARLNHPSGIRCDARGRLWIADSGNHAIRLMTEGFLETVAGLLGSVGSSDGTN